MADRRCPTAFTVVARNYLPAATVLAKSYRHHHPDHRFRIAVIDSDADEPVRRDGYEVVGRASLGIDPDEFLRMATAYSVTELATAVKPSVVRTLRAESDVVIYLDPDIVVYAPMPELVELAMAHPIVLTPHCCQPIPRDGMDPSEAAIMGSGVFNLGFLATGPGSEPFLDFWVERLRHDAIAAPERQLFTDQRWVDLVPAHFPHHVLRDPGFNVAYWNAHERPVRREEDGSLTAGGKPLRFFHFSGYRPEKPWILSQHAPNKPRVLLSEHPVIRELCADYGKDLRSAGYAESLDAIPYGYAKMADGTPISMAVRRMFGAAWVSAERENGPFPPHAFSKDGGAALRAWLSEPPDDEPATSGLTRLTEAVWNRRADLREVFPQPHGRDAAAFREWLRTSGRAEGEVPAWALTAEPEPLAEPDDEFGVNVVGYLTAELGVGEQGRNVHDAIVEAGVPVASVVEDRLVHNRTNATGRDTAGRPRFPITVLCVNADQTEVILQRHAQAGHHRYRIGLWAWELEDFPGWLHPAFGLLDEVWVVSEFCRAAIARHSPIPVKVFPVPVRDPHRPVPVRAPGEPVRFLFAFDYNSVAERKNPWGVVEAFRRAFGDRDDVRLVIKSINADKHTHSAERLRAAAGPDPRIELIEDYLTAAELDDLYASSHCYVSLHRSEGFGLTVADAMARGMPVIATGYSSTTEFLDHTTGWPVGYHLVEVGHGRPPYSADSVWADPDLDEAAAAMRVVADDSEEAGRRGRKAREHILATRSIAAAADWTRTQLTAAYQTRTSGRSTQDVVEPLEPLQRSREALHWRPETTSSSRMPLAPALRKAVLRVIDHYDVHQRKVLGAVTDGVEGSLSQLLRRIEQVERRLGALDSAVTATESAVRATNSVADVTARSVDELRAQVTGSHLAHENDIAAVRTDLDRVHDVAGRRLDEMAVRIGENDKKTFEMFVERDGRAESDHAALRDVRALRHALSMLHAPVPPGTEVVLCDVGALLVPVDDVFLPWLAHHRTWEPAEADLLAELATGGLFVDIGAHVGYHTLRVMAAGEKLTGVVAVEANAATAALLSRNVKVNLPAEIAAKVAVLQLAAWDSDTGVHLNQHESGNSGDYRVDSSDRGGGTAVRAVRLDGVPQIAERTVGLIKIDLQGRDHRAIAGLTAVIDRDHPHVVCEFAPGHIEDLGDDPLVVLAGYRELGYRPVLLRDDGPDPTPYPDKALVDQARAAETGFVTIWLRPL
ncbi:FkbM family methyltransferase [Actinocrispum wychmicini]|uniref:FkbM family methyltransferase n=1 Tax=Actinocrispum wychmicini TaxID=1213861 RepID=A0A4V2S8N1_9PSEU|nr:FkbM family methyltransferase [Actinocrispum wychmicini]TCO64580.1 FkbM family methyltransferase [Actinocrispum wychmicini]